MKAYLPVDLGTKIHCDCDDEQCWAGIEVLPQSLSFYRDMSDESLGGIHVELPEGYELCKSVEVNPLSLEEMSAAATNFADEVIRLRRVISDSYGANGLVNKKLIDAEREIERISHLNAQHIKELVQLRSYVGILENYVEKTKGAKT